LFHFASAVVAEISCVHHPIHYVVSRYFVSAILKTKCVDTAVEYLCLASESSRWIIVTCWECCRRLSVVAPRSPLYRRWQLCRWWNVS